MADPLQQVADDDGANAPIPGPEEQQDAAADGQRDANQVDEEIEGQAMPFAPIAQATAKKAQDGPAPAGGFI
jgi:hypothetical protein